MGKSIKKRGGIECGIMQVLGGCCVDEWRMRNVECGRMQKVEE